MRVTPRHRPTPGTCDTGRRQRTPAPRRRGTPRRAPGAPARRRTARQLTWRAELSVRILVRLVPRLSEDPAAASRRESGGGQLRLGGRSGSHASTRVDRAGEHAPALSAGAELPLGALRDAVDAATPAGRVDHALWSRPSASSLGAAPGRPCPPAKASAPPLRVLSCSITRSRAVSRVRRPRGSAVEVAFELFRSHA